MNIKSKFPSVDELAFRIDFIQNLVVECYASLGNASSPEIMGRLSSVRCRQKSGGLKITSAYHEQP
jgi:hypothetical protein